MSLIGGFFQGRALKRYQGEAQTLVDHLRTVRDKDMGIVLAIAAHQRNALIKGGAPMDDLTLVAREMPGYHKELASGVQVLMKKKRPHDALGLQVWVQSLRAAIFPTMYPYGIAIWRELVRGVPYVGKVREEVRAEGGFDLDVTHAGDVPKEFRDA